MFGKYEIKYQMISAKSVIAAALAYASAAAARGSVISSKLKADDNVPEKIKQILGRFKISFGKRESILQKWILSGNSC